MSNTTRSANTYILKGGEMPISAEQKENFLKLINQNLPPVPEPPSEISIVKATASLIANALPVFTIYFPDFQAKYGQVDAQTVEAVMREYAARLVANKITPKRLAIGLERLKNESIKIRFMPNPQAFAELCKPTPDELGVPTLEETVKEIVSARGKFKGQGYQFSHAICWKINRTIGFSIYDLKHADFVKNVKVEYDRLLPQALNGTMEPLLTRLEHKPKQDLTELQKACQRAGEEALKASKDPLIGRINKLLAEGSK